MDLNEKGLEAARAAIEPWCGSNRYMVSEAAIRAYISAAVPADVTGLVERFNHVKAHSNSASVHEICDDAATALSAMAAENERLRTQDDPAFAYAFKARVEAADAEIARLRDAIAEKDKALEPFAEAASVFDDTGGSLYAALSCIRPNDLRAAKAAAQAHFDRAILSTIESQRGLVDATLDAAGDYMNQQYGNTALHHPTDRARIKTMMGIPTPPTGRAG